MHATCRVAGGGTGRTLSSNISSKYQRMRFSIFGKAMADLNSLVVFARVAEANSFSEAARRLKMPISTVTAGSSNSRISWAAGYLNGRPQPTAYQARHGGFGTRRAQRGANGAQKTHCWWQERF
jgi:hypothetical protein